MAQLRSMKRHRVLNAATRFLRTLSSQVLLQPPLTGRSTRTMSGLNSTASVFGGRGTQSPEAGAAWRPGYEARPRTSRLSSRESEVLHWLAYGKSGPEIAIILGISTCTVRIHIQSVKRKLDAVNIPHAVYLAFARGILRL